MKCCCMTLSHHAKRNAFDDSLDLMAAVLHVLFNFGSKLTNAVYSQFKWSNCPMAECNI